MPLVRQPDERSQGDGRAPHEQELSPGLRKAGGGHGD